MSYPSAEAFLDLVGDAYFQLASSLRVAAVDRFSFLFQRPLDGPADVAPQLDPSKHHAVLHVKGGEHGALPSALETMAAESGSPCIRYLGSAAVRVSAGRAGTQKPMPARTDWTALLEAEDPAGLEALGAAIESGPSIGAVYLGRIAAGSVEPKSE